MCLFADLKMSLASLTADGEEQGWQQLLIQKVHYLQNYDHGGDGGHGDDEVDIYIMMKCLSVCVSRKIITSSWEAPVTTCNHP